LQEQARALGDPTRHAIFAHLAQAGRGVGIAELNEGIPLNHNAIRQHLAKLVAAGLVVESRVHGGGRGRPRLVYEVHPNAHGQWGTTGPYERLSRLLVEIIRTGLGAQEVGRRSADVFRVPTPSGDVVADISAAMARNGFDPEVKAVRDGAEIVLHACPFAAVAVADRETVCALHLGIAEGLAEDDERVTISQLVAYDPRKADCRLRIRVAADGDEVEPSGGGVLSLRGRSSGR
jgi:predicted ArsR family transcriptional regulator